MVENAYEEELIGWFKNQPSDYANAVAARCVLRAIPTIFKQEDMLRRERRALLLPIFRTGAILWTGSQCPADRKSEVSTIGSTADHSGHAIETAANSAGNGLPILRQIAVLAGCLRAKDPISFAIKGSLALINSDQISINQIKHDVSQLRLFEESKQLTKERLSDFISWHLFHPDPLNDLREWKKIDDFLRGRTPNTEEALYEELVSEDWGVWLDWYGDRLYARRSDLATELERVTSGSVRWDRCLSPGGIVEINAALRAIEDKHNPPNAKIGDGSLSESARKSRAELLISKGAETQITLEMAADDILGALDTFQNETGLNERPPELERIAATAHSMRDIAASASAAKIAELEAEISALKAEIEALITPQSSEFWKAFKAEHGKQSAITLHKGIRFSIYAGAYYVFGEDLIAKVLPEILKSFGK